ncbi:hypothetical protein PFISCL1PPCAC_15482 [Pristionchus fissidentatus]|uniref:HTH CENPB-type domain-containing protein n=1 Tax=Pristionchus fissidentatus TaxID=1538716 RepID=A0AAV5VXB7_9BILA|nr:hypothetical protein PFISCL1PPCAC_15482 [Pristionchus fissidentatus]
MFSPARVVGLLAAKLGIDSDVSSATREERKLAGTFAHLLNEAGLDSLVYGEDDELVPFDPNDEEDVDPTWTEDDLDLVNDVPPPDRKRFAFSNGYASLEAIILASNYFRSTTSKAHRTLESMKTKHRFLANSNDLRKMEAFAKEADENSSRRTNRIIALQNLSDDVYMQAMKAMEEGYSLHDIDLQVMAIDVNLEMKYLDKFEASQSWVTRFKKFVSKVNHDDDKAIKTAAADFVASIKEEMKTRPLNQICNSDQSGFLKELHSMRSLAPIGEKTVVRCVQSKSSLTHSYTVMPLIFADGSMGDYLFVVLQEPGGSFPKKKKIFDAPNLVVTAGTSHIMTKNHMREWVNKCIFTPSTTSNDLLILLDSWTSFRDQAAIDSSLPSGKTLHTRQIPAGATGIFQPLDVFFFRPFKALVRRIQGYGFRNFPTFIIFQRDPILKVISLSFTVMRAPIFKPMIQYAWHAAGYLDSAPTVRFKTPVQLCFPKSVHSTKCCSLGCMMMSFIKCPMCNFTWCFKCYVIEFHRC